MLRQNRLEVTPSACLCTLGPKQRLGSWLKFSFGGRFTEHVMYSHIQQAKTHSLKKTCLCMPVWVCEVRSLNPSGALQVCTYTGRLSRKAFISQKPPPLSPLKQHSIYQGNPQIFHTEAHVHQELFKVDSTAVMMVVISGTNSPKGTV